MAGVAGFACSVEADVDRSNTKVDQPINGVSCSQVNITATRSYDPIQWTDGTASFAGRMPFVLPAEIPTIAGAPGNQLVTLTLGHASADGTRTIICTYEGNGAQSSGGSPGTAYVFKMCAGKDGQNLTPGAQLSADSFLLHVVNGAPEAGPTTVRLLLDEIRPCDPVTRGEVHFHDRALAGLGGNGRACSDCHVASDHFQLSPATAEARFQALQTARQTNPNADDPLFRPIDADDFRTNGNAAADYSNLRENGLIRITFTLPSNVRLIDPATNAPSNETFVDIWRSVPTVENVKLTGPDGLAPVWARPPNPTGGFQLDARVGTLQEQALGALTSHAQIQVAPPTAFLDDLSAFQRTLFSSPGVASLSAAIDNGVSPLPDPDPVLTPLEEQGKVVFQRACAHCHGGPGQSTPIQQTFNGLTLVRYHNIQGQCPRSVDANAPARWQFPACPTRIQRNARTYEITNPNLTTQRVTTDDPGRGLLTGVAADFGVFDMPSLRGIRHTAPYFHNNSAATLEDVIIHYEEFFKRTEALAPVAPILTTDGINRDRPNRPEERAALLAYLLKL